MSCLVRAFSFSQLQNSSCCQPASGDLQCSSTAEHRAEPSPPLSASSGPPHLLSCWVGSYRRSPLSLKLKHAGLLACHFSSLHSWSFTFVSEVTFSACFSFFFSTPAASSRSFFFNHFFLITALHFSFVAFFLTLLAFSGLLQFGIGMCVCARS